LSGGSGQLQRAAARPAAPLGWASRDLARRNPDATRGLMSKTSCDGRENSPAHLNWRRALEATSTVGRPALWIAAAAGLGSRQHQLQ